MVPKIVRIQSIFMENQERNELRSNQNNFHGQIDPNSMDLPYISNNSLERILKELQIINQMLVIQSQLIPLTVYQQQWILSVVISSFHQNHVNQQNMLIGSVMETLNPPMRFIKKKKA